MPNLYFELYAKSDYEAINWWEDRLQSSATESLYIQTLERGAIMKIDEINKELIILKMFER